MIACVRLQHWAAAVTRQHQPALTGVPLVIGGRAWESAPVWATSTEAHTAGVRIGMPLKQAWALCPDAHFLPKEDTHYRAAYDAVLDLLWTYSDRVEPPDEAFNTDVSEFTLALGRLHPDEAGLIMTQLLRALARAGLMARIGLSANKFTASVGATCGPRDVTLVPADEMRAYLAPLPVTFLPLDNAQAHRLNLLGIHTLGQFAALPRQAMLTQFGIQGPHLHALARGEDRREVNALPCPHTESLSYECEPPVTDHQRVQAILGHLSARIAARLAALNMTCPEVQLTLELRQGETVTLRHRPRDAIAEHDDLLRLLLRLLEQMAISGPVYGITIHLRHLQALQMRQLSLFGDEPDTSLIAPAVLERLTARHGAGLFYEVRRAEQPTVAYLPDDYQLAGVVA